MSVSILLKYFIHLISTGFLLILFQSQADAGVFDDLKLYLTAGDCKASSPRYKKIVKADKGRTPLLMKMLTGKVEPDTADHGDKVRSSVCYVIHNNLSRNTKVKESRVVHRRMGALFKERFSEVFKKEEFAKGSRTISRKNGVWESVLEFSVPENWPDGLYTLVHTIKAGRRTLKRTQVFSVGERVESNSSQGKDVFWGQ